MIEITALTADHVTRAQPVVAISAVTPNLIALSTAAVYKTARMNVAAAVIAIPGTNARVAGAVLLKEPLTVEGAVVVLMETSAGQRPLISGH
jgi:hypothetical protein